MSLDPLNSEQIETALSSLPGWAVVTDGETNKLAVEYRFADFNEAMGFITRMALIAEQHHHHPEIFNVWSTVKIALSTHDAGDRVTRKDVDLARAITALGGKLR